MTLETNYKDYRRLRSRMPVTVDIGERAWCMGRGQHGMTKCSAHPSGRHGFSEKMLKQILCFDIMLGL